MNIKTTLSTLALFAALAAAAQEAQPAPEDQPAPALLGDVEEEAQPVAEPVTQPEIAEEKPVVEEAAKPATTEEAPASPTTPTSPTSPSTAGKASGDVNDVSGVSDERPAKPAEEAKPVAAAESATTDEIDLEEIDDSAIAASRPKITAKGSDKDKEKCVDVDCDEATLADILRQFRKTTGENIIIGETTNLMRRVSVTLRRTPWRQALTAILNAKGFRLDERDGIFRVVEDKQTVPVELQTFPLKYASAKELTDLFNKTYAPKDKAGKTLRTIATCFEGANVVVVTADEKTISDCSRIVKDVDLAVPQIYIEARFAELSSEALHKLGVDWSTLKSWGASVKDLEGGATWSQNPNGKLGVSNNAGTENRHDVGGKGNYIAGTLSIDDFRLAISAFEQDTDARIFSNPKVIVSNGKEAKVDMTTKFPNVELTSQRNTQSGTTYTDFTAKIQEIPGDKEKGLFAGQAFYSYGIELSVKPRISPKSALEDNLISVEISPSISQLDTESTAGEDGFYKIVGSDNDSSYSRYPIIVMKSIKTEFTMKSGSTAVIGGLSKTTEEDVDSGIPYLRKIPWIGQKLFGWKSRQKVQKEIIIFVTLGIANPENIPTDLGLPKNAVMGREYVNGTRQEPGDRSDKAHEALAIDTRDIADRQPSGSVSVKLSE